MTRKITLSSLRHLTERCMAREVDEPLYRERLWEVTDVELLHTLGQEMTAPRGLVSDLRPPDHPMPARRDLPR